MAVAHEAGAPGKKMHYAWLVMIGCGMMVAGTVGSFTILSGTFFFPVCADLGIEFSSLTVYMTVLILGVAVSLPFVGNLLPKLNLPVALTIIALVEIVAAGLMATYTDVWMWCVSGAVVGVCMGFTSIVPLSTIMGNWFMKKTGFAIGVCWAISSLFVAIMSPVLTYSIEAFGWRTSYIILSVVSACLVLPATAFIIRLKPEDKGMLPYGYEQGCDGEADLGEGVPGRIAFKSVAFYLVILAICIIQLTVVMNQIFPTYAEVVGLGAGVGSLMVSAAMILDIALNPLVGATCDKLGPAKGIVIWTGVTIFSFVLLYFGSESPLLSCIGAGINDTMYVICGVGISSLTLAIFGTKDYGKIFAYVVAAGYVVGSFGLPLMMGIFEATGVFQNVFAFCIVLDIVIAAVVLLAWKSGKKLSWERAEEAVPDAIEEAAEATTC